MFNRINRVIQFYDADIKVDVTDQGNEFQTNFHNPWDLSGFCCRINSVNLLIPDNCINPIDHPRRVAFYQEVWVGEGMCLCEGVG